MSLCWEDFKVLLCALSRFIFKGLCLVVFIVIVAASDTIIIIIITATITITYYKR